ncbi:MAG: HD domain-containing protein [Deltaproteobacteria bacterium]|nr:HD domain-containing protein [Deltaproteobacteria bacterium]
MELYTGIPYQNGEITPQEAWELLQEFGVPHHIIEHSKKVAEVACFLGRELRKAGYTLELSLVEAGAFLHDVAKAHSLKTGEDHARLGGEWLRERGLYKVADIVYYHVHLPDEEMRISEIAVVNYADKRVMETTLVSIKERFEYIIRKYGVDESRKDRLNFLYERIKKLEQIIFAPLPFGPEGLLGKMAMEQEL